MRQINLALFSKRVFRNVLCEHLAHIFRNVLCEFITYIGEGIHINMAKQSV